VVEIISVGNELLLGNTINTNGSWVAAQITKLGGKVSRITTVADDLDEISHSMTEALRRKPSLIITTGGIGPTFDDMTLKGVATALGLPIRVNKSAVEMIRSHYTRRFPGRKISLSKPRFKMASIPAKSVPIINPIGTAPAVRLTVGATEIFCLPGVPSEAKAIFKGTVSKVVGEGAQGMNFVEHWIPVGGIMESSLAPMIDRVMRRWTGVYIKSHPRGVGANGRPNIELHFSTFGVSSKSAKESVRGAVVALKKELKNHRAQMIDHTTHSSRHAD
jgi:nicotinamide-nucleotide amidase